MYAQCVRSKGVCALGDSGVLTHAFGCTRERVAELSLINLPVADAAIVDLLLTMGASLRQLEWVPCPPPKHEGRLQRGVMQQGQGREQPGGPQARARPPLMSELGISAILSYCEVLTRLYIETGAEEEEDGGAGALALAGSGDAVARLVARARLAHLGCAAELRCWRRTHAHRRTETQPEHTRSRERDGRSRAHVQRHEIAVSARRSGCTPTRGERPCSLARAHRCWLRRGLLMERSCLVLSSQTRSLSDTWARKGLQL